MHLAGKQDLKTLSFKDLTFFYDIKVAQAEENGANAPAPMPEDPDRQTKMIDHLQS
jgi:hypothetical protein